VSGEHDLNLAKLAQRYVKESIFREQRPLKEDHTLDLGLLRSIGVHARLVSSPEVAKALVDLILNRFVLLKSYDFIERKKKTNDAIRPATHAPAPVFLSPPSGMEALGGQMRFQVDMGRVQAFEAILKGCPVAGEDVNTGRWMEVMPPSDHGRC